MVRPPVITDMRAALADRVFPTVTVWNRLEGRPRTTEFDSALKAEVRDALWMLARQWQLGEFRGEDAGSPVSATYHLRTATATRYRPGETEAVPLPGELPLEAVAGRRAVPFLIGTDLLGLDLRLMMGRRWTKLMNDAINPPPVRQAIIDRWPVRLPDPTSEADTTLVANPDVWATTQAVAGRSMDGFELYAQLKGGGHSYDATSGINNHWKQELDKLNARFITWFDDLIAQPGSTPEAYDPARLEHRFALGVPESAGETVLSAAEYPGGTLDWYGFSYDQSGTTLGTSSGPATAASFTRTISPGPVQYPGMPNPRWWMFEDGKTDFGAVTADSTDLVKTLFLEFALVFSDDWFLLPCDLDTGALARVDGLMLTDVFGHRNWIEQALARTTTGSGGPCTTWTSRTVTARAHRWPRRSACTCPRPRRALRRPRRASTRSWCGTRRPTWCGASSAPCRWPRARRRSARRRRARRWRSANSCIRRRRPARRSPPWHIRRRAPCRRTGSRSSPCMWPGPTARSSCSVARCPGC